jgi:hypothetical protein
MQPYPEPNADAVMTEDGGLSFTINIRDVVSDEVLAASVPVTTGPNVTFPGIRDAALAAVGAWMSEQAGGNKAAVFNAVISARMRGHWTRWAL